MIFVLRKKHLCDLIRIEIMSRSEKPVNAGNFIGFPMERNSRGARPTIGYMSLEMKLDHQITVGSGVVEIRLVLS